MTSHRQSLGPRSRRPGVGRVGIVVVAASAGGLTIIEGILASLPAEFPLSIVIVQHLGNQRPSNFVEILRGKSALPVRWLSDRARLVRGVAYVAPPGRHAVVHRRRRTVLLDTPRINHSRPAADPLFASAAAIYGRDAIGVVLTGWLSDGASGALAVRRAGGVVIVQDPVCCSAPSMPRAAITAGAAHFVLPPNAIANALIALTMMPGTSAMFGWPRGAE